MMESGFIIWNADPGIISIFGREIRWYGILFAAGFYLAYMILSSMMKKEGRNSQFMDKLTMYTFIGTIAGLRLGHCLFYQPDYYLSNPLEILMIWKGGLASHGGAAGILISTYIFSRKLKLDYLWLLSRLVIVIPLTGAFVRIGNLMNSEIYGKASDVPWAFIFSRADGIPRHPTQIYEAAAYLLLFAALYTLYAKQIKGRNPAFIFGIFLTALWTLRFFIEFVKEVQVPFEIGMALNMGQLLSLPFISAGIIFIIRSGSYKNG